MERGGKRITFGDLETPNNLTWILKFKLGGMSFLMWKVKIITLIPLTIRINWWSEVGTLPLVWH